MVDKMRSVVLQEAEVRGGRKPDTETGETHRDQQNLSWLLFADPVMETALMNPALRMLMTYLLGKSHVLSSSTAFVKGPGQGALPLHNDAFVPSAQLNPTNANATFQHLLGR